MADAGGHDFDQNLALPWAFEIDFDNLKRLLGRKGNGGTGLHRLISNVVATAYAAAGDADKKHRIQPATRSLSFGASSEAIAPCGSGTTS
jgi:hypothetical protein